MSNDIINVPAQQTPRLPSSRLTPAERRFSNQLAGIQGQMLLREARVMAEGTVAAAKMQELDILAREAINGQVMLARWADTLAGSDPLLHDELMVFRNMARMAKTEIMAGVLDKFVRESRLHG